ncbi:hypothetical protein SEA_REINDEER_79 [Mycobacterium phage Reindeer]|uniref:dATP/dGTP diphosphohydrolase N-terminal domain-containing protein n=1 Tax=Mycobacterium phage Reindeer TaxID=2762283 RepID=A0A7G8LI17_9CAUD|nr:hypothetical protein J4U05_gp079 [Mycobacterium phage Reindeer]QNJ56889.1 hypothetical protein SEA_REINDEER_79 [Mycobacterium phage Reindeer]
MSANEVMTVSSTGAQKAENDERYDLIAAEPLRKLAKHFGVGAKKYADRNWEAGYEWHKSFAALNRHLWQFWNGEDIDPETGSPHIVAVMWHAMVLTEFMETHPEFDDRPNTVRAQQVSDEDADDPMETDSLEPSWTRKYTWDHDGLTYEWGTFDGQTGWFFQQPPGYTWLWSGVNSHPTTIKGTYRRVGASV